MKEKSENKFKRINIKLYEETHMRAKVVTAKKKISLGEYFSKAIEEQIERDKSLWGN